MSRCAALWNGAARSAAERRGAPNVDATGTGNVLFLFFVKKVNIFYVVFFFVGFGGARIGF